MKRYVLLFFMLVAAPHRIYADEPVVIHLHVTAPEHVAHYLAAASPNDALASVSKLLNLTHHQPSNEKLLHAFIAYLNELQNDLSILQEHASGDMAAQLDATVRNIEQFMEQAAHDDDVDRVTRGMSLESINREKINSLAEKMNAVLQKMAAVEALLGQSLESIKTPHNLGDIDTAQMGIIDWLKTIYREIKRITGDDTL